VDAHVDHAPDAGGLEPRKELLGRLLREADGEEVDVAFQGKSSAAPIVTQNPRSRTPTVGAARGKGGADDAREARRALEGWYQPRSGRVVTNGT
jgi:hypothetical protein